MRIIQKKITTLVKNKIVKSLNNKEEENITISNIQSYPISLFLRRQYHKKNVLILGEGLHSIHPVAGQGWNLGIKDIQKLIKLSKNYSIDDKIFNSIYYSNRIFESSLYLGFTSLLNFLYENEYPINYQIIKFGHFGLRSLKPLRDFFIKQAMGRSNLI